MTTTNEELRRLADAATPGPWTNISSTSYEPEEKLCIQSENGAMFIYDEGGHTIDDARFIAAANPAKVKAMLDQIDTLVGALQMAKHIVHNHGSNEQMDEVFAALESVGVKP